MTTLAVARVTLEMTSAFAVGTGHGDDLSDMVFVTDANGLPTLPGSSLAGILRHAWSDGHDEASDRSLFGFQAGDEGQGSRLSVSFGQVHDQKDRVVAFRTDRAHEDEVLNLLRRGVGREHVRLSHRGAADDRGKFDELLVPAGARFTFELALKNPKKGELDALLALLNSGSMRLGRRTRNGLGCFCVRRALIGEWDLKKPADRKAYARLPVDLATPVPSGVLTEKKLPAPSPKQVIEVTLRAQDYWIFGGDPIDRTEHRTDRDDKAVDMVPKTEAVIRWGQDNLARIEPAVHLVPASSVKGALRHRAAFHARRRSGSWADTFDRSPADPDEVLDLFGTLKGAGEDRIGAVDRAGRVFPSDVYVDRVQYGRLDHVSLDRFTQGALRHHLFNEAPLHGGDLKLRLDVDGGGLTDKARGALADALDDLCEGRLALGAGGNRGHGYFTGTWNKKSWLEAR